MKRRTLAEIAVEVLPERFPEILDFLDRWPIRIEITPYIDLQLAEAEHVLPGSATGHLQESEGAVAPLRETRMAPDGRAISKRSERRARAIDVSDPSSSHYTGVRYRGAGGYSAAQAPERWQGTRKEHVMYRIMRRWRAITVMALLIGLGGVASAEEGTVKALAPWDGQGQIFQVGPTKAIFMGSFSGIMYVQSGERSLDALLMLCPGSQEIDLDDHTTLASGYCTFQHAGGDRVFAKWRCAGEVGACEGNLTLTGGTGEFEGIEGGGEMSVRTVLADMAANLESGSVVRSASGLAVWPRLSYRIPAR